MLDYVIYCSGKCIEVSSTLAEAIDVTRFTPQYEPEHNCVIYWEQKK